MPDQDDALYYFSQESKLQYSQTALGDPDINRLVEGKADFWINPTLPRVKKKKTLIITSENPTIFSEYKPSSLNDKMIDLIESGFEIYLYENGKLTALTLSILTDRFDAALRKMKPSHPDEAIDTAISQLKISKDQIQPLDDDWFSPQIHGARTFDGHTIYTQWFKEHNEQQRKKLISVLQQSKHPVKNIIYEAHTDQPLDWLKQLTAAFPKATLIKSYRKVSISGKTEAQKFAAQIAKSQEPHPELVWLTLNCAQIPASQLTNILRDKAPNLNSLTFNELSGQIEVLPNDLPNLRAMILNNCTLTLSALEKMLTAAPQLTHLDLLNCTILGSNLNQENLLPNLQSILFFNCTIHATPVKTLLTTLAPHLENLALFKNNIPGVNIGMIRYPILSELLIDRNQTIIPPHLKQLTPNLHHLIFDGPADGTMRPMINSLSEQMSVYHPMTSGLTEISSDGTSSLDPTRSFDLTPWPEQTSSSPVNRHGTENNKQKLDADTSLNPDKKFDVNRIFYSVGRERHPDVRNYRLDVYQGIKINDESCPITDAFELINDGDLNLVPRAMLKSPIDVSEHAKQLHHKKYYHYYGKQRLLLNNQLQALASLSANDEILRYHVSPDTDVEILYSNRDNLYYIRSKNQAASQVIDVDFILKTPKEKPAIPTAIQRLVDEYLTFGEGALEILKPNPSGHDYLQAIQQQKKGACRHRALAFKALMETNHPAIPVRIVTNDCHAFVEININEQWVCLNLGGYDAKLDINDSNQPMPAASAAKFTAIPANDAPNDPIEHRPATTPEEQYLETWNKHPQTTNNIAQYCQQLLQRDNRNKRLVELSSTDDVHAMQSLLQQHCLRTKRPIFYVNSPDDLVCSASWIEPNEVGGKIKGTLKAAPGGRLHQFLTDKSNNEQRILLINYDHFSPADIVRFNSLLDKKRTVDGVTIPTAVTIIGLTNTNSPNYYQGSDFSSRFNRKIPAPSSDALQKAVAPLLIKPRARASTDIEMATISLYHAPAWKEMLLGRWVMNGDHLTFEEGKLQAAVKTGLPIIIQQGLWDIAEFRLFWEQAKLHGRIEHSGGTIIIPKDLQLIRDDHYNWANIIQNIRYESNLPADAVTLNPGQLNQFFNRYRCDNTTKTLHNQPGLLAERANGTDKTLHVHLTRELEVAQWARLGDACNQHHVQLLVHAAPGVTMPEEMNINFEKTTPESKPWDKNPEPAENTLAIASTDIDTTTAMLTPEDSQWQVMDISACKSPDLLTHIKPNFDKKTVSFQFVETKRALLNALEKNKKVILKGHFSPELIDELAPLLITRATEGGPGQLVLVGKDAAVFNFMGSYTHNVCLEDKQQCLKQAHFLDNEINQLPHDIQTKESLSRLHARLIHQRIYPDESTNNAWLGMHDLPDTLHLADLLTKDDTKTIADAFNQERVEDVFNLLRHSPYAYLTGLTGVGKTTFVEKHIKTDPRVHFFHGESSIKDWASVEPSDKLNVLFIDEVNLSHQPWSAFEGLFHKPPGILIDGIYYPLSKQHKVIFAGNPISYGDERQLSPLFANHGSALLFEPIPLAAIYEDILKPIFESTTLATKTWDICQPFMTMYRFLCEHAHDEVLISPRELQMMAILVLSYMEQHPEADSIAAAKYYAHHLTTPLVPEVFRKAFAAMPLTIEAKTIKLDKPSQPHNDPHFLLTPSRQKIATQFADLLALRELRQVNSGKYNPEKLYGGLGGMVLTGEPGIGKSEMVIAILRQHGYKEAHFRLKLKAQTSDTDLGNKIFYRMPVSLPLSVKQALLLKAFNEGTVVVVDELNSSPMMERWFNDLLMGKNPLNGNPPLHPGFMLIGTQNPANKAGRRRASTAFARRIIQETVPSYPHQEMCEILIKQGLNQKVAKQLVRTYEDNREYAKHQHLEPEPTFRDLLAAAEIAKKRTFSYALQQLNKTITIQPNKKIKERAIAVRNTILKLKNKGEKNLTRYINLTKTLLTAPASMQPKLLIQFQQKATEAQGHFSKLWRNIGAAMLLLGIAVAIAASVLLTSTGIGALPGIAIATSSVALLASSAGIFAFNHQRGLSKTMSELHDVINRPSVLH